MEFVAIIPARYASTRFPGKPLAMLGGKPVIRRVYEQVTGVLPDAVVATDDERILRAVEEFGGRAVMTSSEHRSGTATGKFNGSLDFEQTPLYAVYPAVSAMNGFTAPDRKSTRLNSSHTRPSRMPSSA